MTLLNFKVGDDFISVEKDNLYLDLHSSFDFAGFNYSIPDKEFHLRFTKSSQEWASKEVFDKLIFIFRGVDFLKIKESDSLFPHDEHSLNDIGFSAPDMRHDMDSFLASNEFQPEYDMIFIFQSGQTIKIHSKEALLETK